MNFRWTCIAGLFVAFASMSIAHASAKDVAKVMLIGGQNNHDWRQSTPYLNHIMGSHEKIECMINNAPSNGNQEAWADWDPKFEDFDVVVLNYNGRQWPEKIKQRFVSYVRCGGNVVLIHAANNAFTGWSEFEQMVGLLWRSPNYGPSIYLDDRGETVRLPKGQGKMGHGGIFDWVMTTRDRLHPIAKGMPRHWMHARDELYHGQRGPAKDLNVLFTAYSDPRHGGTGRHEPIVWWIPYGKGKVITNLMGHVGDIKCMQCVGFQTVLQRSCLWLAGVTFESKVPDNFPISSQTSVVELSYAMAAEIEESRLRRLSVQLEPRENGMSGLISGLEYSLYSGTWSCLPSFTDMTPEASGTTDHVTLQVTDKADHYAVRYVGFIMLDESGDYGFYLNSDDGSKLLLNDTEIVNNDGIHGENEEGAKLHLSAGVYQFEVQFFEASGGENLTIQYSSEEISKRTIPPSILFHQE